MKNQITSYLIPIFISAVLIILISNRVMAQTNFARNGNAVVLQNELVKIEYDLSKGTWSAYNRKDKTSNIIGAALQINDYASDERYYLDFCTENPFETLEQYGLSVKAAQKVHLKIHDFPTVCA